MHRVSVVNAHVRYRLSRRIVGGFVRQVLRGEARGPAEVSIVLIDGARSRSLNRKFLGHDRTTDVMSFSLGDARRTEGEVYINLDRARHQASVYAVPFMNEVARLVVHGTLHLLGYDDRRVEQAKRMHDRQERYVSLLVPAHSAGKHG